MKVFETPNARVLSAILSLLFVVAWHTPVSGADTDVVLIEEFWELQVGGPDVTQTAPQVTMIMSPTESLGQDHFAFTVNHWSYPDFEPGGYQLQSWYNENCAQSLGGWKTGSLNNDGEVVSWVQQLSVNGGYLRFRVHGGTGETWSSFGGDGFHITIPTTLTQLNTYRPAVSLEQSGIGFAGNRVSSLTLTKLRWKTADDQYHEMVAPIDIDADLDP